jgi:N-acetylglutamate synthase-like GNAT family acetyltransferase
MAYLLTDAASGYWRRHGFQVIDRESAPAAITASREWAHACPANATAMRRPL